MAKYSSINKTRSVKMRIRLVHPIKDRIKVLMVLLFVLVSLVATIIVAQKSGGEEKQSTIEKLLTTAMQPVGNTMYIWGGGWDGEDQASGATATRLGLSETWSKFAEEQDENYDFEKYRFEREKGLDCSGYVGWVLYNTFEKEDGESGYVTTSTDMATSLAERGWGKLIKNPRTFLPGDIVSMEGHVWICLGTCEDGSVLLVHSSPPGVSVCGTTSMDQIESHQSVAVSLATEYMTSVHSNWQERYPNRQVDIAYLENVILFRWSKNVMLDAEEMQGKTAEEIMRILSPDM